MPFHVKSINHLWGATAIFLSFRALAFAQDGTQASSSGPSVPPQSEITQSIASDSNGARHEGTPAQNSNAAALDYLFNRKPQDGSFAKQASQAQARMDDRAKAADALGLTKISDPQLRARFERYLGIPEIPKDQLQAYSAQITKISELLKRDQVFEAWKELRGLAIYEAVDAGVSLELANRIEAIWATDKASGNVHTRNQQLREEIKIATRNADLRSESIRTQELKFQKREREAGKKTQQNNGGVPHISEQEGPAAPSSISLAGLEGRLQLTDEYLRSLEAKAKIKVNELKLEKLLDAAKADFSGYISTLYGSNRHQHVILAANFYRRVFNESDYPVSIANQVNASLEVAREVKNAVEVFNYKLGRNELSGATDRLQEAFIASEFDPAVLGVLRSNKERVADFTSRLSRMQNLIEARDFGNLATLLDEMKAFALDFDATKPLAIVNAVKLESKLRMGKAKLAAQQGDLKLAMEEFQAAAEAWPGNPDLEDSAGTFFTSQDVKNQSVVEFDRLIEEKNYRAVFDKQLAFAPSIHGDAKREENLKNALEKIKGAEIAYEKANLMRNAGDVFGAWETIEGAVEDLPGDIKLNMFRAELSGKGAEFVAAINKAKEAETRKELGYSLSCYAVAQRYYPASTLANEGIKRISKEILERERVF